MKELWKNSNDIDINLPGTAIGLVPPVWSFLGGGARRGVGVRENSTTALLESILKQDDTHGANINSPHTYIQHKVSVD